MMPVRNCWGVTLAIALGACGGKLAPEGMGGKKGMLSATNAAAKCEEAAKDHDRPFVVEWDATDLASFEAKAARDTVVVKYEGCDLEILHQCSDAVAAGKFGAYGTPQFTSGATQGFEIKNEGELYAKLPLGAAKLSARVSAGEALSLTYHVTGVATSSREALYGDELLAVPGCEGATHFVWAYNLGAFELSTLEQKAAEAEVGIGNAGGGARGSTHRASLSQGDKLAACESHDQRGCRVPIRLALREIAKGQNPIAAAPSAATGDSADAGTSSRQSQAQDLWKHALGLYKKGDGAACVQALDKALAADMRLVDRTDFNRDRAICLMASGDCDEGKKHYRAAIAAEDRGREMEDFQLDRKTRKQANKVCPAATADDHADFLTRARREITAAAKAGDAKRCEALIKEVAKHEAALLKEGTKGKPDFDLRQRASEDASNSYAPAGLCVAKSTKRCKDGEKMVTLQCKNIPGDHCKRAASDNWKHLVKLMKVDCK